MPTLCMVDSRPTAAGAESNALADDYGCVVYLPTQTLFKVSGVWSVHDHTGCYYKCCAVYRVHPVSSDFLEMVFRMSVPSLKRTDGILVLLQRYDSNFPSVVFKKST